MNYKESTYCCITKLYMPSLCRLGLVTLAFVACLFFCFCFLCSLDMGGGTARFDFLFTGLTSSASFSGSSLFFFFSVLPLAFFVAVRSSLRCFGDGEPFSSSSPLLSSLLPLPSSSWIAAPSSGATLSASSSSLGRLSLNFFSLAT